MYLGVDISKYHVSDKINSTPCYAMSADSHIKKALQVVQQRMAECGVYFKSSKKTAEHPSSSQSYRPELDITEECNDE